jgi:hypothetical protein
MMDKDVSPTAATDANPPSAVAVAEPLAPVTNTSTVALTDPTPNATPTARRGMVTVHAKAVAVVDAEIADSLIELTRPAKQLSNWSWLMVVAIVVAVTAVVGVGAYCGAGNCGGLPSTPTPTPISAADGGL